MSKLHQIFPARYPGPLMRRCNKLCASGFVDDVILASNRRRKVTQRKFTGVSS